MNDTELDDILNTWTAPDPSPALRGRVRAGYRDLTPRRSRFRIIFWTAAAGFAVFLFALTAAFPQTAKLVAPSDKVPYTVETEFTEWGPDGSITHHFLQTSYMRNGREVMLSQSIPDNPLGTLAVQAMTGFHLFMLDVVFPFFGHSEPHPDPQRWAAFVARGCDNGTVIGHETILNYPVTISRPVNMADRRVTLWTAPGLDCFILKIVHDQQRPDGTWRVITYRRPLKVTVNSVQ